MYVYIYIFIYLYVYIYILYHIRIVKDNGIFLKFEEALFGQTMPTGSESQSMRNCGSALTHPHFLIWEVQSTFLWSYREGLCERFNQGEVMRTHTMMRC
jgi:hypothetical protein